MCRAGPAEGRDANSPITGKNARRPAMMMKYFSDSDDHPDFIKALAEVRRIGVHEGWCYHHVQAIIVAIDQYAEAATGNREFFWNKPHSTPAGTPGRRQRDGDFR